VELENKSKLGRISAWIFIGLLAYMPLHIFLSTWIGTSFGVLSAAKIAKDVVMVAGVLMAGWACLATGRLKSLWDDNLFKLICAFAVLNLILVIFRPTDSGAELLGLVSNTRFLLFFVYAWLLVKIVDPRVLRKRALVAVMASAFIVLVFGLAQRAFLPSDFLTHFGYSRENGVLPAFFIDNKPDLPRIISTLRDPNSFGSYLIIIGSLATVILLVKPRLKRFAKGLLVLSVICLWFSFSRSAWLGFLVALAAIYYFKFGISLAKRAKQHWLSVAVVAVCLGALLYFWQNSYFVQNVMFHADKSTVLEDPNQLRERFWRESVVKIVHNPLGQGPGTAGLVSIHNKIQGTTLNENYYLQMATELGVLGIGLFLAIIWTVGRRLWRLAGKDWLALALLASFMGLFMTNFFVHIWSNEAVAYTWWGLAGAVIFSAMFNKKSSNST